MKKLTFILFLLMVVVFSAGAHKYKNAEITISIQTFYDQLSPYGDWIYSPDYGYVWRPYFDHPESFRPYSSNGNWVYTDYGWTWASGYSWGWATFHYGRWDFDNYLGWLWVPGYEWAPAWVSWGSYNNYWGWAPLGPNIYVNSNWYAPDPWWTFVPQNHFCASNWNRYIYNRPVNVTHITHITNIYGDNDNHKNHNSWYYGPRVTDVERYSSTKVRKIEINNSHRPEKSSIHNNRLDIYRPTVENKHNEYRPAEYRSTEQARYGKKIEQSNARTNDPGVNRTRKDRPEIHSTMQTPSQRSSNVTRAAKAEPRNVAQKSEERISNRQADKTNRETPAHETLNKATESNRQPANNRLENSEKSRYRNNVPAVEDRGNSTSRETGSNRATNTQPIRENRTREVTPSSNSRIQNTETQKTTREDVKKSVSESRKEIGRSERRSSENPERR